MKLAGFLLMLAGSLIALASLSLLQTLSSRTGFVLAAVIIEIVGLVIVARSQLPPRSRNRHD